MANFTLSTYMGMPVPTVGIDPGPDYADNINSSLAILDQHDHSSGKGTQITPSGININSPLSMQGNSLTNIQSLALSAQASLATASSIYVSGVDLYFNDGNGILIRLTQSGSIVGTTGSISGLTSPASASYVSATPAFVFQSAVNTAADLDGRNVVLRNAAASSKGLTLSPPNAMGANYSIVLPPLPASQKIMTLDSSGNMTAPYTVDGSTIEVATNVIQVKDLGISTAKLAADAVTTVKILDGNVTPIKQSTQVAGISAGFNGNIGSFGPISGMSVTKTLAGNRSVMIAVVGIPTDASPWFYSADATQFHVAIKRDGTQLAGWELFPDGASDQGVHHLLPSIMCIDNPTAGSHTYTLDLTATDGTCAFQNIALQVVEL